MSVQHDCYEEIIEILVFLSKLVEEIIRTNSCD
jgi:hypothetical protein